MNYRKSKPITFNKGIVTDVTEQLQPVGSYRDADNIRITSLDGKHFSVQNINGTSVKVSLNAVAAKDKFVFRPKTDFVTGENYQTSTHTGSSHILVHIGVPGGNAVVVKTTDIQLSFTMFSLSDLYTALADALNAINGMGTFATFSSSEDGLSYQMSPNADTQGYTVQKIQIGSLGTSADADVLGDITDTDSYNAGEWLEKAIVYPGTSQLIVVGHYSFINELYLYTKNETPGQGDYGHIHKLVFGNDGELDSQQVIYGEELKFKTSNKLIVRGIIENNCVQRLVWTDNINPLRTINVLNDNLQALSVEALSATPQYQLSHPIVQEVTAGSLPTGMYEYGYKLLSEGGADTSVSTLSNIVPIGLGDFSSNSFDMVGDIAIGEDNSGKGLQIEINGLDENFDRIKIYVIYYANNLAGAGQLFEVTEEAFSGTTFSYVHSNLDLSSPLILEEFTVQNNTWRFCKAIEVKDNILFAANLRSLPESFTFDAKIKRYIGISGATSNDPKLQLITERTDSLETTDGELTNSTNYEEDVHRYWALPIKDSKQNAKFRRILGGHTDNFDNVDSGIRLSFHLEDRIAEHSHGDDVISVNTESNEEAITGQTPSSIGNSYPISNDAPQGHSNPLYTSVFRGYQRGETYRFGIVFYDRMGNPGFAKYIGDIKMPNHEDDYWRFDRSNEKTAGSTGSLSCYMEADCPDYRLSYVEGFWGPAQVDKVFNTLYTDNTDPVDSGYLPKGFLGGSAGVPDYKHRLTDLYLRFEVKLSNSVKESISGFKIVRAERTEGERTVVSQGMINPMGIAGGDSNLEDQYNYTLNTSFSNQYQLNGGGSWADDFNQFTPAGLTNHSYPLTYAFKLFPINFGSLKNKYNDGESASNSSTDYPTGKRIAGFANSNPDPIFGFVPNNISSANQVSNHKEYISFNFINASNALSFGWPAASKAVHPKMFTFDSLDLMGGVTKYQRKAGDKLKVVSVLSQYSQLRRFKKLSWEIPSADYFSYYNYFDPQVGPGELPYQPPGSAYKQQFISTITHHSQTSDILVFAAFPNDAFFQSKKEIWSDPDFPSQHKHVEWYVEDTGLYNKRSYRNQRQVHVNDEAGNQLDNSFDIKAAEKLNFGEVKPSFLGFEGNGVTNRGGHDMALTHWGVESYVHTFANAGAYNSPHNYNSGTIDNENGYYKHWTPFNFSQVGNIGSTEGGIPVKKSYVTTFDVCNPTLGIEIDTPLLGINLLPEFYFSSTQLYNLVTIGGKNVLDYRDIKGGGVSEFRHESRQLMFYPHRYLCNITRVLTNQYGGKTDGALASTRYISTGHFTPVFQNANKYAVTVSGGDTHVNIFAYNKFKGVGIDTDTGLNGTERSSGSVSIPIESKINFDYTHHKHFKRGDYLAIGQGSPSLSKDYENIDFVEYYDVYSQESTTIGFLSDNEAFDCVITNFPNQIAYSNTKLSGDVYNAWDTFPPANFHDVDGNLGEINSLFLLRDSLFFIQERGIGNLAVNPRTVITDSSGGQIFTGTGDTVQDHSYLSTEFGTIHQHSVCVSDSNAYWADAIHDELFSFDGRSITSIGDITANRKLLRDIIGGWTYINANGIQINGYDYLNILKDNDAPIDGKGIHSVYDHKNNEAIFTFFDEYKSKPNQLANTKRNFVSNTLAYNEQLKLITSKYEYHPNYWISHDNRIFSLSNETTNKAYNTSSKTLNLWDDELATLCTFEGLSKKFSLKMVFNENPTVAKIFDNLDIIYEAGNQQLSTAGNPNPYKFTNIIFTSPETDNTQTVNYTNGDIESYRDGILKLPIRSKSASNRIRGTYITTEIVENVNMTKKYNIFALGYKYRQSNR